MSWSTSLYFWSASYVLFFFNDTATTEIYTLSLHDALPIYQAPARPQADQAPEGQARRRRHGDRPRWQPADGQEDALARAVGSARLRERARQLVARRDPELAVRVAQVELHRLDGDEQVLGDLAVGAAGRRHAGDPKLRRRERRGARRAGAAGLGSRQGQ